MGQMQPQAQTQEAFSALGHLGWKVGWTWAAALRLCCPAPASDPCVGVPASIAFVCGSSLASAEHSDPDSDPLIACLT